MTNQRSLLLLALLALIASPAAEAQSDQYLQYAGVLEKDGVRLSEPVTMRFGIFTDADASCLEDEDLTGCPVWTQEIANVPIANGRFSVRLGPVTKAGLEAEPQLIGVAVLDGTTWRKLGDAAPLDPAPRAHTAGAPNELLSRIAVVGPDGTGPPYSAYSAEANLSGAYSAESAPKAMTPLESSVCFLTMGHHYIDGRQDGTYESNVIVHHRNWCRVRPNATTGVWELVAHAASGYADRPAYTQCEARCVSWR